MYTIQNPFAYFNSPTNSKPIGLGHIYIGLKNTDPTLPENQIDVFAVQPCGCVDPYLQIQQPIQLLAGGIPSYNGAPIQIVTGEVEYSISVKYANGNHAYYTPLVTGNIDVAGDLSYVNGIKNLKAISNETLNVVGFYENTTVGGGQFIYDATRSVVDHNGGTVIAAAAIAAWDGTQADIATLLDWTGTGVGCFIRIFNTEITPEMFGAAGDLLTDDKISLTKAFSTGKDVVCDFSYGISGTVTPTGVGGFKIKGAGRIVSDAGSFNALDISALENVTVEISVAAGGQRTGAANGTAIVLGENSKVLKGTISNYASSGVKIDSKTRCEVSCKFRNAAVIVWDPFNDGNGGNGTTAWSIASDVACLNNSRRNDIHHCDMASGGAYGVEIRTFDSLDSGQANDNTVHDNLISGYNSYGILFYRESVLSSGTAQRVLRNKAYSNSIVNISGGRRSGLNSNISLDQTFGAGIYAQGADDSVITDNVMTNTNTLTNFELLAPGAVGLANTVSAIVTNNISNNGMFGYYCNQALSLPVEALRVKFSGNIANRPRKSGYKGVDNKHVSVENLDTFDPVELGITANQSTGDGSNLKIIGGQTVSAGQSSVYINDHADVEIINHTSISPAVHGFGAANVVNLSLLGNKSNGAAGRGFDLPSTLTGLVSAFGNTSNGDTYGARISCAVKWAGLNTINAPVTAEYDTSSTNQPFSNDDGTATPEIKGRRHIRLIAGADITNFLGGSIGDELILYATTSRVIVRNVSILRIKSTYNMTAGDKLVLVKNNDGRWDELSRTLLV